MVVNRGDIKRKRKDDSCLSVLDESPKRTKVHAQRKFAQGSNVSSPVITPVKEIERQERNKDVLPEPIDLLPMKRPNTDDFLTFLCFRGTPILPSNLNFFNAASMIDSRSQTEEPKTIYPKNGPILTSTATKSQNERPFIAFGVRKRADPIVISKQMDRKRRHALALQALRRKYQEQKMAKIRAVTISKLSEKVSNKNVVKTRSITKSETVTKKPAMNKSEIKVVSTKHITTKTAIKQPIKSKMCLRSFRGRYIHKELNIQSLRKRTKIPGKPKKVSSMKRASHKEKSSSEFSSDDDEPLMKSLENKVSNKKASTSMKKITTSRKVDETNIRLTRSHNKLNNLAQRKPPLKHRRIITRLSSNIRPTATRMKNKKIVQTTKIIRNVRRTVNSIKREQTLQVTKLIRSTRQQIIKEKIEKNLNLDIQRTRSRTERVIEKQIPSKKEDMSKSVKVQNEDFPKKNEKQNIKYSEAKSPINKETLNKKEKTNEKVDKIDDKPEKVNDKVESTTKKVEKLIKKNEKQKNEPKVKLLKKVSSIDKESQSEPIPQKDSKKIEKRNAVPELVEKVSKVVNEKCKSSKAETIDATEKNTSVELIKCKVLVKRSVEKDKISNCRPSRKTKEAAALYMELLGHKLVNDNEIDDDNISIDSFPELPNVRKTEQRENELKAKVKSKPTDNKDSINKKTKDINDIDQECEKARKNEKITSVKIICDSENQVSNINKGDTKTPTKLSIPGNGNGSPSQKFEEPEQIESTNIEEESKQKDFAKEVLGDNSIVILTVNKEESFDDKDKNECKIYKQVNPTIKSNQGDSFQIILNQTNSESNIVKKRSLTNSTKNKNDMENTTLNESDNCKDKVNKKTKRTSENIEKNSNLDQSFSDSDEEPLSKLTKSRDKITKVETVDEHNRINEKLNIEKPKRECTKKPHNYLPFSSSDDEEKYFHGFVKAELKTFKEIKTNVETCPHSLPSDLSCKDVSRRYGKGKVNMSNEQIEKWLNDSAMAGMNIKKEDDEMLKFDEKISPIEVDTQENISKLTPVLQDKDEKDYKIVRENEETLSVNSTPEKTEIKPPIKSTSNERKTIFKKEKTEPVRNVNAFSVSNECSVYAFEADNEDSISTPFRRPSRRPSSTATSKSEDEAKMDDITKHSGKFRLPTMLRNDLKVSNKQEIPHAIPDETNNSNIAIQVNFENQALTDNSNSEPPSISEDIDHLFYTTVQSQKHSSPESSGKTTTGKVSSDNQLKASTKLKSNTQLSAAQKNDKSMFPPANTVHKGKSDSKLMQKHVMNVKCSDKNPETFEDLKYKVPSSPSASSSSSAKLYKKQTTKSRNRLLDVCNPVNTTEFPNLHSPSQVVEAPTFHPTEKEFQDPLEYIEKIRSKAEKFGICRIVPPANFKPECKVSDDMRFTAYNQYVHKMLHRWGPNFKELIVIRKYLETQNITLTHPPWIGGMEIDLPRLYQTVQSLGGLKEVIEKKKWSKVSDVMKIPKSAQDRVTKLDDIYCKYLLPYDTLSPAEREKLFDEVETEWAKKESKTLLKAQRVTKIDSSNNELDSDSDDESEECIVKGRNIALNAFYRIARNTMSMWFKTAEPFAEEVEQEFWKHVTLRNNHICVHSGSIDSGNWGYGFAVSKNSPFARHAWNLKVLTNNSGSVLRSMGPIMGVTVPTLHVGMVFSACCWYRDPHSLPWIEYLHTGAHKIWYAIPDSMSNQFHTSMLKLVPNYCRNKSIWLPSDTVMIPPKLLVEQGVSLCRTVQEPGQFIVVFPKVFTSSVSTGYVVSESVYFAPLYWLHSAQNVFNELRQNSEPSMFSIDRLLLSITSDTRSSIEVLKQIIPAVQDLCNRERKLRAKLHELGLSLTEKLPPPESLAIRKRKKLQQESGDYECEICRSNLFISLVNELQDDVVYCLEHVIQYIEQKKVDIKNCKLLFTYECDELDLLVDKIKKTIEMKQQKKIPYKVGLSLVK